MENAYIATEAKREDALKKKRAKEEKEEKEEGENGEGGNEEEKNS